MKCPRCNFDLAFVCHEDMPDGSTSFEYICQKCLSYMQDIFSDGVLIRSNFGDMFYGRD